MSQVPWPLGIHLLIIYQAVSARQMFKEQVFGNAKIGKRVKFLMNDPDARLKRFQRRGGMIGFAVRQDAAIIRLEEATKQIDQGRFAGTVFAEKNVTLCRFVKQAGCSDTRQTTPVGLRDLSGGNNVFTATGLKMMLLVVDDTTPKY